MDNRRGGCLIQEIEYVNDEAGAGSHWPRKGETPEERYERVRKWVMENIRSDTAAAAAEA